MSKSVLRALHVELRRQNPPLKRDPDHTHANLSGP